MILADVLVITDSLISSPFTEPFERYELFRTDTVVSSVGHFDLYSLKSYSTFLVYTQDFPRRRARRSGYPASKE